MKKGVSIKRKLIFMAFGVWYIGFIALSLKSYKLFQEAYTIDNNLYYIFIFMIIGLLLSLIKTKYIFIKSCKKNITRIEALKDPKIWQFYRVGFFIFLITVISLGAFLSHMASGDYWFLVSVGIVDISLALALFFSGFVFIERWQRFRSAPTD